MQRNKQPVTELLWELRGFIKFHSQRSGMGRDQHVRNDRTLHKLGIFLRDSKVHVIPDVGIWPTVESAILNGRCVFRRSIVTEIVTLVHSSPDGVRSRLQRKPNRVTKA